MMRGDMNLVMLSTSEISMKEPRPVRERPNNADTAVNAASMPAIKSAAGVPIFCGGLSASPVRSMTPL
jgi:hypothetical protein